MTILIHPGLHKTGTTYLQDRVFAADRAFHSLMDHHQVDRLIVRPHPFDWTPGPARGALDRALGDAIPVLSSEVLAGNPLLGAADAVLLADRLHRIAPDARVLLTVRRQSGMATALYQQYLKRGGTDGPAGFLRPAREPGYPGFDPTVLRYSAYAELYGERFGAERVLVLPQEHLAADGTDFVRRVAAFAGRPLPDDWRAPARGTTGRSPHMGGHALFRAANHLRRTPLNPGGPRRLGVPGRVLAGLAWRARVGGERERRRVAEAVAGVLPVDLPASNQRLQAFCPIDLAALGYDMAPAVG